MYVCIHVCIYVCMCVYMYIYIFFKDKEKKGRMEEKKPENSVQELWSVRSWRLCSEGFALGT